ncbi:hypothetical protein [Massilia glaciei]|uniref:Uncharacterized protein n=1 Tax=Massilia glaciei TaxID=1524097 RepID=A0A2U2HEZ0_9BURK|nr:hypothetical protein [Massilia glaciei]PWF42460.1 hypothetical protein C7C56_022820 [Massilia glaciei]
MVERRAQNRSLGIRPSLFSENETGNPNPSRILNDLERRGRGQSGGGRRPWRRRALWTLAAVLPLLTLGLGWWWATATFEDAAPLAIVIEAPPALAEAPVPALAESPAAPVAGESVAAGFELPAAGGDSFADAAEQPEAPAPAALPEPSAGDEAPALAAPVRKVSAVAGKGGRRAAGAKGARRAASKAARPSEAAPRSAAKTVAPTAKAGAEAPGGATVAREKDVVLLSAMVAHRKPGVVTGIIPKTSYKECLSLSGKAGERCRVRACRKIGKDEVTCRLESRDPPRARMLKPV